MRHNHAQQIHVDLKGQIRENRHAKKWDKHALKGILICSLLLFSFCLSAQPSGGPYGPIKQSYELPKTAGKIYYAAPDGNASEAGEKIDNPTTIEAAIERVVTGDVIVLRGGIYRTGNLTLNQGITVQPYKDEEPVLKGTYVATEWKKKDNGLWVTKWEHLFPMKPQSWWRRHREGAITPPHRFNNDMVFVDGKFLQSAGWEGELDDNTYFIDYETGMVYLAIDPTDKLVEVTAFNVGLHRVTGEVHGKKSDSKGPAIKGITFTQYAYRAIEIDGTEPEGVSKEADHGKQVVGATFENCTLSFCSRFAAYLRGDRLTMRNCKVSDTSTEGIYIVASNDVLLEKNIFTRNNIERLTGYYPAAVKIFNQSYRVTCNDNLIIDLPYSNGIWYDVGNVDGVFTNNWIEGVGIIDKEVNRENVWPSDNGFFFEISKGAICAGNVFVNCDHGILVLNASNVQIFQNTFINSMACIGRNERSAQGDHFGWHPRTGPDVDERTGHVFVNNLLTGTSDFKRPLLWVWQKKIICDQVTNPQLKQLDYNTYVREPLDQDNPLILWGPANNEDCYIPLPSPVELNKQHSEYSAHDKYFADDNSIVFKSQDLGNYQLQTGFSGKISAIKLPEQISATIGLSKNYTPFVGAFPQKP